MQLVSNPNAVSRLAIEHYIAPTQQHNLVSVFWFCLFLPRSLCYCIIHDIILLPFLLLTDKKLGLTEAPSERTVSFAAGLAAGSDGFAASNPNAVSYCGKLYSSDNNII